jgi:N-sulfoglucosamine sulfohydrolase
MRAAAIVLSLLYLFTTAARAAERNIVFYIADDMGAFLGCYGYPQAKTPHMDALAADGVIFTRAYATTASCSASRSVIMTGLHNHANGQYGHQHAYHKFGLYPNTVTVALPQVMRQAGYRTGLFGKNHVGPGAVIQYDVEKGEKSRNTVQLVETAFEFMSAQDERPFIAYIGTSDPHRDGKTDNSNPYKPNMFGNLADKKSFPGVAETFYQPEEVFVPPFLPDTPTCRAELVHYYQSVSRVDAGLGHLVKRLKEAGLYDKTLIIVTSDHGMAFPGGKTTVYEPGLNVPLIVRNPYAQKRGLKNDALVSHTDLTPTMLDLAGGLDPKTNGPRKMVNAEAWAKENGFTKQDNRGPKFTSYHGRSWLPILEQTGDPSREAIYASHTFHEIQMYYPMRVIRDGKYKLIWNIAHGLPYPFASDLWAAPSWQAQWQQGKNAKYGFRTVDQYIHRPAFELYDMEYDPDERTNLALDPAHRATLEAYQAKLKKFQEEYQDPWVQKWDYE